MARDMNCVCLTGRLTRDPELRSTPSGTSVCRLGLAVNERFKNGRTGEWEERANFFDITVWGKQGEACAQYLAKGRMAAITGRLRWESWETDAGRRSAVSVTAESVQFLGDGKSEGSSRSESSGGEGGYRMDAERDDVPIDTGDFERATPASADSDDIPFLWRPAEFEDRYEHGSRRSAPLL